MYRILVIAVALMLSGCWTQSANFKSIYRDYRITPNGGTTSVVVDAKQRAIISMPTPENNPDNSEDRAGFVCAEPSPDALAAISAAFAGGFENEQSRLQLANVITETASELGRRNATIQLLRDGLYRQCEAYMNGLIGPIAYENIAVKYINSMVVLLAIEEITPEMDTANGDEPGSNGPGAEANVSSAEGGGGNGALPEENDTDDGEAADDSEAAEADREPTEVTAAASSGNPMVKTAAQGGDAEVSEAVAKEVAKMARSFLRRDTINYCLYVLFQYEVSESFTDLCKTVVLNEYQQQDSNNEPSGLTETQLQDIIHPK